MPTRRDFTTPGDELYVLTRECEAGNCWECTDPIDCDHHCHQAPTTLRQAIHWANTGSNAA